MPDLDFPISCKCCNKPIYGPIAYCPFCGEQFVVSLGDETSQNKTNPVIQEPPAAIPPPPYQPEIESFEIEHAEAGSPSDEMAPPPRDGSISEESTASPSSQPNHAGNSSGKPPLGIWKWAVACCIILILSLATFFYLRPTTPRDCTTGKSMAADVIAQGVQLSIIINKIAAQEKVLNAAKKLSSISDRYASQSTDAEKKLQHSREISKTALNTYRETIDRLCHLKPDCISSALAQLQKERPSDREKLVMGLVAFHVQLFDNGGKLNQERILSDFREKFLSFSE